MVKYLHGVKKTAKLLVLGVLILIIWGGIWLQTAEHSLNFAKPWILASLNPKDSPYSITFDDVSMDWRRVTQLGTLRVTRITIARDNNALAQLPEVYVTIDPIGFLPSRHTLHTVALHEARLYLTRNADNVYYVGLEGAAAEPIPVTDLIASLATGREAESKTPIRMPFSRLIMDKTTVRFHDDISGEDIVSNGANLYLGRRHGKYNASLTMPFIYNGGAGTIQGNLSPNADREDYTLDLKLAQFPGRLVCNFAPCPEKTNLDGKIAAELRLGLLPTGDLGAAWGKLSTPNAVLTAPSWFAKPVKLGASEATLTYDATNHVASAPSIKLTLEDTDLVAEVKGTKKEDGWYIDVKGGLTRPLEITQLYKYWPLPMASDTRAWVTSKLKAGSAANATLKLNLTPEDLGDEPMTDKAMIADIDAQDITIDYLPNFPHMEHVNGHVHFTGRTVKVEGNSGTMLSGTKVSKVSLWAPELTNWRIPMEIHITADTTIADTAQLLQMKYFTFDDSLTLDPKKVAGTGSFTMALKFDSDSGRKHADPDEIYFDAVNYDITAHIANMSQKGFAGGYDLRGLNGTLTANNKGMKFDGSLALGDAPTSDIKLAQAENGPLEVDVKSRPPAEDKTATGPGNDFSLTYKGGAQPVISLTGKQLDATAKYDSSENSLLKDFPAMKLDIALEKLYLAKENPFTNLKGTLNCTDQRCESANFTANTGKGKVSGTIARNAANRRELRVTSTDAGAFLKSLDITDRMTRGQLSLIGPYDDSKPGNPLNARLLIQDFTLKNSQILGRILSIGSLTGLANALTGSGIDFEKFGANISSNRGVIGVSEGKANGTAMGITVKGQVDTNTTKLKLKGVVVPAYALNSMVGKIPIVGHILAGPDGEGLIAFNYSIDGTYENPDVMVNPLSGLTPGFLRGIFNGFDGPSDGAAAPAEKDTGEYYRGENKR